MRERESVFSDYCSDLRRKEKEEKSSQKEKVGHLVGIVSNGPTCQYIQMIAKLVLSILHTLSLFTEKCLLRR